VATYALEFYEDQRGDKPVLRWIREELSRAQRATLGQAMREVLQEEGVGVCGTEFGRQLGKGLFEFRLRRSVEEAGEKILFVCSATHTATGSSCCSEATTRAPMPPRADRTRRSRSRGVEWRTGAAEEVDL
jgi:hypothetical protein